MQREIFEKTLDTKEYIQKYVDIQEFLECCMACPNYRRVWSCPPYDFDPMDIWKRFDKIYLYAVKFSLESITDEEEARKRMLLVKDEIAAYLMNKERDYDKAVCLGAGKCSICGIDSCARMIGEPCRSPGEMRYSIESLGGDVGRTLKELMGIDLLWVTEGKIPEYYVLVGGLLYNEN